MTFIGAYTYVVSDVVFVFLHLFLYIFVHICRPDRAVTLADPGVERG
jgi:hypothetical protein